MLETRQKVLSRLGRLREVQFYEPSVAELHGARPLIGRVQRKEYRLYRDRVRNQEKEFKVKLMKIEKYYADLQAEERRRLNLLSAWERGNKVSPKPVFQPIRMVVFKPSIGLPGMPLLRRTRLH